MPFQNNYFGKVVLFVIYTRLLVYIKQEEIITSGAIMLTVKNLKCTKNPHLFEKLQEIGIVNKKYYIYTYIFLNFIGMF